MSFVIITGKFKIFFLCSQGSLCAFVQYEVLLESYVERISSTLPLIGIAMLDRVLKVYTGSPIVSISCHPFKNGHNSDLSY